MDIKVIQTEQDFIALKKEWDKISQGYPVLNSFGWLNKWWEYLNNGNELYILAAYQNGILKGIAPLYIENSIAMKFLNFRSLCFLGGDVSDYMDFIIFQNTDREEVFVSFLEFITKNIRYDLLDLIQINNRYPNFDLWQKYSRKYKLSIVKRNPCHRINLFEYENYDEYLASVSKHHRRNLKCRQNKIAKSNSTVKYEFKYDITEFEFKEMADLNIKRQKYLYNQGNHKRDSLFADPQKNKFIFDVFNDNEDSAKFFAFMKCNDKIISYMVMLQHNKTIFLWNMAFDTEYEEFAPSKILINEIIKYAYSNGYQIVDFMRGDDKYKSLWSNDTALNIDIKRTFSLKAGLVSLYRFMIPSSLKQMFRPKKIKILDNYNAKL